MDKFELAMIHNTPPKVLEKLANDEDVEVRYYVADNPNTPPEVLEKLSNDKMCIVRYVVAQNPNTPKYNKIYLRYQEYLNCYQF